MANDQTLLFVKPLFADPTVKLPGTETVVFVAPISNVVLGEILNTPFVVKFPGIYTVWLLVPNMI